MQTTEHGHGNATPEEPLRSDRLRWSVTSADAVVVVELHGEVDMSNAEALAGVLGDVLQAEPATLDVDLANVWFLDSSGVKCLLKTAQAAADVGCKLVVRNPTDLVMQVLTICGVDQYLLVDSREGRGGEVHTS